MAKLKLNSKEALQEIRNLITEINNLKAATSKLGSGTAENFKKIEDSSKRLKTKVGELANRLNYLDAIMRKQAGATRQTAKETAKAEKQTKKHTKATKDNAKAIDKQSKSQKSFNISLKNLTTGGLLVGAVQLLDRLAVSVFENIKTFDSLGFTLQKITKDQIDFENTQRFLLRITEAYGVALVTTTVRYSRFLAAAQESGLALRETEQIFESMTKASAALGLNTQELESVYLALEQMLSKGKVTTEELRRQLGERLPGAMGIMASAIGVTIPELDKMLKRGEVLSAEVLPKFAKAVEQAYGIEQADRIETLVAKQNRLTTAWQNFIKTISEGDGIIKRAIGGLLNGLEDVIQKLNYISGDGSQRERVDLIPYEEDALDFFRRMAETSVASSDDIDSYFGILSQKVRDIKDELNKAFSEGDKDRAKLLEESLAKELTKQNELEAKIQNNMRKFAQDRISIYKDNLDELEQGRKEINALLKDDQTADVSGILDRLGLDSLNDLRPAFLQATAQFSVLRKLIEETDVNVIDDEDLNTTQRVLRRIKDFWLETMNEIAKLSADAYKASFDDETLNFRDRLDALKNFSKLSIQIRQREFEIVQRDREDQFKKEVDSLNKSVVTGNLSRAAANEQIKKLEKEKSDFIRLENLKLSNDIIKLNNDMVEAIEDTTNETFSTRRLSKVTNQFDQQIIAAKQEFESSKKNAADREKLETKLSKIVIARTNEIIDVKIDLLNEEIKSLSASGEAHSEYIEKLIRDRDALLAQKAIPPPVDENEWGRAFDQALNYAQEFTNSVGDLISARFDRKIEYINAEIDAEERKYAKLIKLAEDDEEQQATLERNRDQRLEELEAKRLKQQQKQAKAQKAFAIADIGISTAQAIMKIWANSPDPTGLSQGLLTGIIAAIGAAQIATVLATPIPQFKEGVKNLSKDQVAMINDGSYQEYVERNGRILSTDKKDAIVPLEKGDTVYKNYDDMIKNSNIFKIRNREIKAKSSPKGDLKDITKAVAKGISKSKINNQLSVKVALNDEYKSKMSKW